MTLALWGCRGPDLEASWAWGAAPVGSARVGLSQVGPPPPGAVRLVTWNVHNLFDPGRAPTAGGPGLGPSAACRRARLQAVGRVLAELQGDLLALQEVEHLGVLEELADGPLGRLGYRWRVLIEGNDLARGIDVALLSRVPLKGARSHRDLILPRVSGAPHGARFSRDCLEVHVDLEEPLVILVNHFKSSVGGWVGAAPVRRAQALAVAALVAGLDPARASVAVVGDLNDRPGSWALAPLAAGGLLDPLGGLPESERATYVHRGAPQALDHLLVSPPLARRLVPGSVRVIDGPAVRAASDHLPLLADLARAGPSRGAREGGGGRRGQGHDPGETAGRARSVQDVGAARTGLHPEP